MGVRDTIILNRQDLRYLLIDSLRLYSDNVVFIDGNNPYRFAVNKKTFYVLIKNVHESGHGRGNQDECRIQVSKSNSFNLALNSSNPVIVLGYFADENVFTAWNPFMMRDRFNTRDTISLYSRFSVQKNASREKIDSYVDNNNQSIISFVPDYLGLYLDNLESIHLLTKDELSKLVLKSDDLNSINSNGEFKTNEQVLTINHSRQTRDPNFRLKVYDAYNHKCAMCGIGLELIEAAHIVPHSHDQGTDEVTNGISLCSLHHKAYDRSLIYFDKEFKIHLNENKVEYLEKVGKDSGIFKFTKQLFEEIKLPLNRTLHPNPNNILIANESRGIII